MKDTDVVEHEIVVRARKKKYGDTDNYILEVSSALGDFVLLESRFVFQGETSHIPAVLARISQVVREQLQGVLESFHEERG